MKPQQTMTAEEVKAAVRANWTEAEFQRAVIDLAHDCGWVVAHFRKVRVQRKNGSVYWETPVAADGAGWPDLVLTRRDRILAAELKVGRNKPTGDQVKWLARLNAAGVAACAWRPGDWDLIVEELR